MPEVGYRDDIFLSTHHYVHFSILHLPNSMGYGANPHTQNLFSAKHTRLQYFVRRTEEARQSLSVTAKPSLILRVCLLLLQAFDRRLFLSSFRHPNPMVLDLELSIHLRISGESMHTCCFIVFVCALNTPLRILCTGRLNSSFKGLITYQSIS